MDRIETMSISEIKGLLKGSGIKMPFHMDPAVRKLWELKELANKLEDVPTAIKEGIDDAVKLIQQREDYCEKMTSPPGEVLKEITAKTATHPWQQVYDAGKTTWNCKPLMISSAIEGQFLQSITSMTNAKRVLEIGLFTGHGALAMAETLPDDGELVSCEFDPYLVEMSRSFFEKSPHGKKIRCEVGPASDTLKQLGEKGEQFDLIFLDADKDGYLDYYKTIFEKSILAPRGTLIVDNALFMGTAYLGDHSMTRFNRAVYEDETTHQVLLPIRDGVSIIRRKNDVVRST